MNFDDRCLIMHLASQAQCFANASGDAVLAKKTTSNDLKSNERQAVPIITILGRLRCAAPEVSRFIL